MTTRIENGGPSTYVSSGPTAYRTTATPNRPFQNVMSAGASAVLDGAEAAVSRLPGGPILAASFRSTSSDAHGPGGGGSSPTGAGEGSGGTGSDTNPTGSNDGSDPSVQDMLSQTADQNLYFLELQEQMAAENRKYTALSNVLRARHETVKNAIGNIR